MCGKIKRNRIRWGTGTMVTPRDPGARGALDRKDVNTDGLGQLRVVHRGQPQIPSKEDPV